MSASRLTCPLLSKTGIATRGVKLPNKEKAKVPSSQKVFPKSSREAEEQPPVTSLHSSHNSVAHQPQQIEPIDYAPNPAKDDAKREELFCRFYELKGELGDVFIEIEEAWRRCLDWEQVSKDEREKEAWEHSRKTWDRFYTELRWNLVFHHFGFLPTIEYYII